MKLCKCALNPFFVIDKTILWWWSLTSVKCWHFKWDLPVVSVSSVVTVLELLSWVRMRRLGKPFDEVRKRSFNSNVVFFMGFLASCCTSLVSSLLIRQWWQFYKGQKQSCKCCKHTSKQNWYFEDFTAPGDYSLIQQKPRIVTNWWALTAERGGREGLGMSISESDLSQARPYYTGVKCAKNYRTSFASSDKIANEF